MKIAIIGSDLLASEWLTKIGKGTFDVTTINIHSMDQILAPGALETTLEEYDSFLLPGGRDISSSMYNSPRASTDQAPDFRRDRLEAAVYQLAVLTGRSIAGICRGMQIIACLQGAKLVQHDPSHVGTNHGVILRDGEVVCPSSYHHQLIRMGVTGELLGIGEHDFNQEIIHWPNTKSFGVQFHPEWHKNVPTVDDMFFNFYNGDL